MVASAPHDPDPFALYGLGSMGKTCLLVSLAMPRYRPAKDIQLTWLSDRRLWADDQEADRFDAGAARIREIWEKIENGSLPDQTEMTAQPSGMLFELEGRKVALFDYAGQLLNDDLDDSGVAGTLADELDERMLNASGLLLAISIPFGAAYDERGGVGFAKQVAWTKQKLSSLFQRRGALPIAVLLTKWDRTFGYEHLEGLINGGGPGPAWSAAADSSRQTAETWLASQPSSSAYGDFFRYLQNLRRDLGAANVAVFAVSALGMTVMARTVYAQPDGTRVERYWPDRPAAPLAGQEPDGETIGDFVYLPDGQVRRVHESIDQPGAFFPHGSPTSEKAWRFPEDAAADRLVQRKLLLARRADGTRALASFGMDEAMQWVARRTASLSRAQTTRRRAVLAATFALPILCMALLVLGGEAIADRQWIGDLPARVMRGGTVSVSDGSPPELLADQTVLNLVDYAAASPMRHIASKHINLPPIVEMLSQQNAERALFQEVQNRFCYRGMAIGAGAHYALAQTLYQRRDLSDVLPRDAIACIVFAVLDGQVERVGGEVLTSDARAAEPTVRLRALSNLYEAMPHLRADVDAARSALVQHPDPDGRAWEKLSQHLRDVQAALDHEKDAQVDRWSEAISAQIDRREDCHAADQLNNGVPALVPAAKQDELRRRLRDAVIADAGRQVQLAEAGKGVPAAREAREALDRSPFDCALVLADPDVKAGVAAAKEAINVIIDRRLYDDVQTAYNGTDRSRIFDSVWRGSVSISARAYLETQHGSQRMAPEVRGVLDFVEFNSTQPIAIGQGDYVINRPSMKDATYGIIQSFFDGNLIDRKQWPLEYWFFDHSKLHFHETSTEYRWLKLDMSQSHKITLQFHGEDAAGTVVSSYGTAVGNTLVSLEGFKKSNTIRFSPVQLGDPSVLPNGTATLVAVWQPVYPSLPDYGDR